MCMKETVWSIKALLMSSGEDACCRLKDQDEDHQADRNKNADLELRQDGRSCHDLLGMLIQDLSFRDLYG